ncbi:hypothetical protein BDK51DRAFT_26118 [Blyttiomyces helicus]|uniref:Uncharacterized protein n=1 Tax=Blyttiomyces helicus TaxID=388810 RepID=A0A4P9W6C1_9FUNG|nr:hypothetical protein BDK51DRAFT_26118 [Blyttiomyces helicus]|eukprot:RKO85666.1 hypothetical protein BDK51DRAFT_26118 [Blyttiomyces helicus]
MGGRRDQGCGREQGHRTADERGGSARKEGRCGESLVYGNTSLHRGRCLELNEQDVDAFLSQGFWSKDITQVVENGHGRSTILPLPLPLRPSVWSSRSRHGTHSKASTHFKTRERIPEIQEHLRLLFIAKKQVAGKGTQRTMTGPPGDDGVEPQ